uniref:ABC transporter C-terminal domain-containing protein n=1 Tax=Actinotalea sp. C106 TaxID=2908644 RepID=UPI0025423082
PGTEAGPDAAAVRAARKEITRIDRQLGKIAEREAKLHARMAEAATDHAAVTALDAELRELTALKDELEEQWMTAAEIAG